MAKNEFSKLRPEQYSPKAREAFGQSLIDISVGIYKNIMLLFLVSPLGFMFQQVANGTEVRVSFTDFFNFMASPMYFVFLAFLVTAFGVGHLFRKEGLRHIYEAEQAK